MSSLNLRVPGPTPLPQEVLTALSRQMIDHRSSDFNKLLRFVTDGLKQVYQTKNDMLLLTASGTGGLEAAVANTLSPGERTLVVSIGAFGDRVASIVTAFGGEPVKLSFPVGTAADPEKLRAALKAEPNLKTVFITHNETSTGVTNDLGTLAKVVKGEGKTLVVDGVSSLGSLPCPVDEWGIDLAVSGSQKGWMAPPGLAMISVSAQGWETIKQSKMAKYYFSLTEAKAYADRGETPWTPAVSTLYAMEVGLQMILKEGVQNVFERHAGIGAHTRRAVKAMGFKLVAADEQRASNTVTAVYLPEGAVWKELSAKLRKDYNVVLAGGQASLSGKIFRVGHLGWVSEKDVDAALAALKQVLPMPAKVS